MLNKVSPSMSVFTFSIAMMYANFPAGLSIFHSNPSASQFGPYTQAEELTDVLSAEAQDTAIAKYGIAGRVWYIHPLPL